VLRDGLAGHVHAFAELSQRLPVLRVKPVKQDAAAGVGQWASIIVWATA
jgi:hypothetical protein